MGGERSLLPAIVSSTDGEVSSGSQISRESVESGISSGWEGLSNKLENGEIGLNFEEFLDVGCRVSSTFEVAERQRRRVFAKIVRSYGELQRRVGRLEEAKQKILSYTPGSLLEKTDVTSLSAYKVPEITSLLLIGPKGCGKSSLVNKISGVFEDDIFASERAQVSCNSADGEGTYFFHEYIIPRRSGSFCLYDTRSLSDDSSENSKMLNHWMMAGVSHGLLVQRKSDSSDLKARLIHKNRKSFRTKVRAINFVIFVVNGLSVLESLNSEDERKKIYTQSIATTFKDPMLSFKDDKPVVVVTHGDLLSVSERARIRFHIVELLGIPPKQIFDIPDDHDPSTALTICDMLHHCLERADRNLPSKTKICEPSLVSMSILSVVIVTLAIMILILPLFLNSPEADTPIQVEWHKIRHIWSEEE